MVEVSGGSGIPLFRLAKKGIQRTTRRLPFFIGMAALPNHE